MDEIIELIKEKTGADDVTENSELENDLGCTGDDFSELMEEYSKKFNVDMSDYLWYFHHHEEGMSTSIFYKSPTKAVTQIPITPKMLYEFSKIGKWNIKYPEHTLPNNRFYNLWIKIKFTIFIVILIFFLFKKVI